MPIEPNEQEEKWNAREREMVYLLTEPDRYPSVWSVADLGRELDFDDPEAVVRPLVCAGLLHRLADKFVIATPAAYRWVQIVGRVI